MNTFNNLEKKIAVFLGNFPKIKFFLKKLYQKINFIFYNKNISFNLDSNMVINKISISNQESFFGYYGASPLNSSSEHLIFHSTKHRTINKPDKLKPIDIVLFDFTNSRPINRFETFAYNWQQGSKLTWIDQNHFIFNDYDKFKDLYISKIVDIRKRKIQKIIDYPIYDVKSSIGLSVSFDRLHHCEPDYGYRNKKHRIDISNNKDDGIFLIDLESNDSKLIISIEEVINLHYKKSMNNAKHWINHIIFSPDGNRFIFIHRWSNKGKRFDSLFVYNFNTESIKCIADDDMVSHCCWKNNEEIIVFKRSYKLGDKYFTLNLETDLERTFSNAKMNTFGDGHPTVCNKKMLFDTYPDKSRIKHLMSFNIKNNNLQNIGSFFENFDYYGETRCDLHPRWSFDGSKIFVDSVHTGKRFLYKIEKKSQ